MNISRSTYFTLVTDPIKQYFQASIPAINDEMWFETDSRIPLKWYINFQFYLFLNFGCTQS